MSDLEEQIRKNRAAFDDAEPPKGHAERFEKRMGGGYQSTWKRTWYWAAAAVVVLIALIQVLEPDTVPVAQETASEPKMTLAEHSPDMAEVETYFTSEITGAYQLIKASSSETNGNMELLVRHLSELEKDYEELKTELYRRPDDKRVLNRMVENYRLRLKLMEWHLNQLKRTPKKTENENV